jgi:hypothetical protein
MLLSACFDRRALLDRGRRRSKAISLGVQPPGFTDREGHLLETDQAGFFYLRTATRHLRLVERQPTWKAVSLALMIELPQLLSVAPAHIGSCKFRLRQRAVPVRTQPACAIPGRRRNFLGGSYRATHPRSRKSAVGEGLGPLAAATALTWTSVSRPASSWRFSML